MERTRCCVVGGGPAGMFLGLLLARAGVPVTVLEKHADFLRDFRGDTVHPQTLALLEDLGLAERFARIADRRMYGMRMRFGEHHVTVAEMPKVRGYDYAALVPQWDLLNLLAEAAAEEPCCTLLMETRVTGPLRERDGRVRGVRYTDRTGAEHELEAQLTIAADGRWSGIRDALQLPMLEYPVPTDVWQLKVPKTDGLDQRQESVAMHLVDRQVVLTLDRGDYFHVTVMIPKGADQRLRAGGLEPFRARLAEVLDWPKCSLAGIERWDEVKLLEMRQGFLRRWFTDGALCIGDAAHPMTAAGGVGVNLAVADAVAVARTLAPSLATGSVSTPALARVQHRRQAPTLRAQRMQRFEQDWLLAPVLEGSLEVSRAPLPMRVMNAFAPVRELASLLGYYALRPEPTPALALRRAGSLSTRRPGLRWFPVPVPGRCAARRPGS